MTNIVESAEIQQLVKHEYPYGYCRKYVELAASIAVEVGTILDEDGGASSKAGLVTNTNEANADLICLEARTTSESRFVQCLFRGPAVINGDMLQLETDVTRTEVDPVLEALGIAVYDEPTNTEVPAGGDA